MKKIHYTYLVVNNLNGKYYIGKHSTSSIDDGYMGSGKVLRRAIKRHGIENFSKDIFAFYDTEEECFNAERELIAMHINDPDCYNLAIGGRGGSVGRVNPMQGKKHDIESIKKMREVKKGKIPGSVTREKTRTSMVVLKGKAVGQYSMDGDFIERFDSISLAVLAIGRNPKIHTGVKKCVLGKQNSAYGFKWKIWQD